ncbi:PQQ-binding-like beta-propeller repeat protein [Streptomyces sp. SID5785]|uniref:serine/threonine-protein kinase n=1 Tax=Streptomyces sp. SID5785 TaxID=2690309 RepID=UPI001361E2F1|nr:serine/threonine-protein kinase [Streptomyces sp. SID5785]MZD03922.1 PQQ-binding-like beta-propeller repeat protein [Streptomyces sp. SID5785]
MPTPLAHDDPVDLDGFRLVARLGSGGMGTVYVARGTDGATVALKTMHAAIASDPAARTRFRLETDAARVIGERFGAKVVAADPLAPVPWLATEYVLGPPLDEAVQRGGALPEQAVRALGASLCAALGQLHRSDVVHRDLKPSNILVTAYGPKVIDFGIARAIGDDRLTRTGSAVGTPAFMSPEQASGMEHGPAGDVFALAGVLVYAARAGGPFGAGQPADLLYRVRYAEPDLTGVPQALVPVLVRCLDKDPRRRPSTSELAAQLHDGNGEFVDHLPDSLVAEIGRRAAAVHTIVPQRRPAPAAASPEVSAEVTETAVHSRRRVLGLSAGVLTVGAAGAGGAWWWRSRSGGEPKPTAAGAAGRNLEPLWQVGGYDQKTPEAPTQAFALDGLALVPEGSGGVAAVDLKKPGRSKWRSSLDQYGWQTAVADGRLYRLRSTYADDPDSGPDTALQTLDPQTGKAARTVAELDATNDQIRQNQLLCVADDIAYVAVGGGRAGTAGIRAAQTWTLRAVDCRTGRTRWSTPLPRWPDNTLRLRFVAARVTGRRLVTFEETQPRELSVVVRDTTSGRAVWDVTYSPGDIDAMRSELAVDEDHVYIGGRQLRAVRLADGKVTWQLPPEHHYGPPTLAGGVVHCVATGLGLIAVDARSGKRMWTEKDGTADERTTNWRPVVGSRHAYYRNGTMLRAVDLTRHEVTSTFQTLCDRFYAVQESSRVRRVLGVADDTLALYPMT